MKTQALRFRLGFCALAALLAVPALMPSHAAAAAPAWTITAIPSPANFVPGEEVYLVVSSINVGGAATAGTPTVMEVSLPAGLSFLGAQGFNSDLRRAGEPSCTFSATAARCETGEAIS